MISNIHHRNLAADAQSGDLFKWFSKNYAMTGFRIGYVCGPADIVGAMTKIHQYTMLCASITGQMAAIEALKNSSADVAAMKKEYDRRRRLLWALK